MILLSYPILGGLHGYWALAKGCPEGLMIRLINLSFTVFEWLQKALYSFYLRLFKVYFLWEYLGSPEKDCVVKILISHISLVPLVSDVVQEVLHVLLVFNMEFSHLYAVGCSRVIFHFYWAIIDIKFSPKLKSSRPEGDVVKF